MNNENAIQQALPWAEIKIIGQGIRTPSMMQAAKAEGFTGMFGHCPYQIGTDSITDYGMPWGSFPNSVEEIHRPTHAGKDKLDSIGMGSSRFKSILSYQSSRKSGHLMPLMWNVAGFVPILM